MSFLITKESPRRRKGDFKDESVVVSLCTTASMECGKRRPFQNGVYVQLLYCNAENVAHFKRKKRRRNRKNKNEAITKIRKENSRRRKKERKKEKEEYRKQK